MNDIIQHILNDSQWPLLTVFLLGLLVAIHPCPLATNVAAFGYISQAVKEEELTVRQRRRIILRNGMLYVLGRTIAYSVLGAVLIFFLSRGIEILPNMVDDLFQYMPLNNDKFTYTFIGTLNENKRIIQLLKCFEKVCESNNNVVLKIAGDGPQRDQVNVMINSSEVLKKTVRVLGLLPREKVLDLLAETNVLVLPSAFETFGVVCIEAMAVGRPVICTRNGSADFVDDSNGVLIDVDSDDQLIDAMRKIYQNYSKYDQQLISEKCVKAYSSTSVMSAVISEMNRLKSKNVADKE